MTIDILQKDATSIACDLLVVGRFEGVGSRASGVGADVDKALNGALTQFIEQDGFEGKFGQTFVFPTFGNVKAKRIAVIGLGEKKSWNADAARKIGAHVVKAAERANAAKVATVLHGLGINNVDAYTTAEAMTEGVLLSDYRFHAFHGTKRSEEKKPTRIATFVMCETDSRIGKRAKDGMKMAEVLASATCYARDLVNTPSSHMTPKDLAEEAKKLVAGRSSRREVGMGSLVVKVMDAKEMEKKKMNAALSVGRGSQHEPVAVHLTYAPRGAKKKIAIVGKAVTFDSGGLSLKPADSMMTMKIDMAGAAAVLGLFKAIAELKPNVEVHGVFLAVENMPGGNAYRPGDVVTAKNGMTIEILNTDAEGRVTLADALCYAADLKPDVIIDLATLTGACVVALGEDMAGLFSSNDKLAQKLTNAAHETGEELWQLPLFAPYEEHIKSKIADIKNTGQRGSAGTISAALFLKPFVGDIPWAHLDIAGPSYIERESRPDQPYGATGYGVRLLAKYLERL